jgi:hypothetical protein
MDMQLEIVTQFVRPPLICDQIFCIVEGVAVWPLLTLSELRAEPEVLGWRYASAVLSRHNTRGGGPCLIQKLVFPVNVTLS